MKTLNFQLSLIALICMALTSVARAVAPTPGTVSDNVSLALSNGSGGFRAIDLSEYQGKILIMMFMTPWCSICQTNTRELATGVIDPLFSASRGSLRGKNDHGVEISTLLVSTEPSGHDSFLSGFLTASYQKWSLDATTSRTNPRLAFSFYRGAAAVPWPVGDRRRLVVINLVENSPTHANRQILANQETVGSTSAATVLAAIHSVQNPPPTLNYATWRSGFSFPPGLSGPDDDADFDGVANGIEFFAGTHPLIPNPNPVSAIRTVAGRDILSYREAKNTSGFALSYRMSNTLMTWRNAPEAIVTRIDRGSYFDVDASFPADDTGKVFYQLRVEVP